LAEGNADSPELGVDHNLVRMTLLGYVNDFDKRCSETNDLLLQLKSIEDCCSILEHNVFLSQSFQEKNMERDQWEDFTSNIVSSITEWCFLSNFLGTIPSNKASACAKKYNAHRTKMCNILQVEILQSSVMMISTVDCLSNGRVQCGP